MDQLYRQRSAGFEEVVVADEDDDKEELQGQAQRLRWQRIARMSRQAKCVADALQLLACRELDLAHPAPPLYAAGEMVLIRSFTEDEQLDYKPEVRGHEHVAIVEECSADGVVTVRLLHRDPDWLVARRPDIVCHDKDVQLVCSGRDHLTVKVAVRDVIKLVHGSVQIGVRKATFRGYTEQFLNSCGGAQVASMYNAFHKLEAPHRNRTVDVHVWDTPPADRRTRQCAESKRVKFPASGIRRSARDGATKASWTGQKAADTWHGLELLASSVNKARQAAIIDEDNPRTWKCGNEDIARALHKIGVQTEVIASQPAAPKVYRERDANGKYTWAKSQQEEAEAWIWDQLKRRFADGPVMFHIYTQSKGYQKANPHPKDSQYRGGGDGHYTLAFAWAEGVTSDGVHFRRVLTARNYQAPRHWVDVHDIWDQMRWCGTELRVAPLEDGRWGNTRVKELAAQNQILTTSKEPKGKAGSGGGGKMPASSGKENAHPLIPAKKAPPPGLNKPAKRPVPGVRRWR